MVLIRRAPLALLAALAAPALVSGQQAPRRTRPEAAAPLPAIPPATGPLDLRVVYPSDGQTLTARDSTFLFGSTGNGNATLTIDGVGVPVAANGAFLAWIALPADTLPVLRFVARLGSDSAVRLLRLALPTPITPPDSGVWLDRASLSPRGVRVAEPGEMIGVSLYASSDAAVSLRLPSGRSVTLVPDTGTTLAYGPFERAPGRRPQRIETRYVGVFPAEPIGRVLGDPLEPSPTRVPLDSAASAWVSVATARGVVRTALPLRLTLLDPAQRPVVLLDDDTARTGTTDGAVTGAALPDGTFHWFFRNGTVAAVSGRSGSAVRLRLSATASAWVDVSSIAAVFPAGTPEPRTALRLVRLTPARELIAVRFAMGQRVPVRVDEGDRRITVRFYSTQMDLDWVQYGGTDSLVPRVTWEQPTGDEGAVTFELSRPVWGWRTHWEGSDLVLEIRRPPVIDRTRPLRGRTIAVDPGHPPAGATGPTGLREAEANLGVALALQRMLVRAGARVVMTRTGDQALGLYERTNLAEAQGAELIVSIHNNAFPDGVNPWENNGTSTYYFHPRAARLAMLVQRRMVARMGLRDLGFGRGDLALVRPTWMPAVLTEGAFLMIPEQENGLRTPAFRERYARGALEGIEAYLREMTQR